MIRFFFAFHEFVCPLMWPFQLKYSDDVKYIYCLCAILKDILLLQTSFLSGCSDRQEGNGVSSQTVR